MHKLVMTRRTQLAGGKHLVCVSLEGRTGEELQLLSYGCDSKFHLKGGSSVFLSRTLVGSLATGW